MGKVRNLRRIWSRLGNRVGPTKRESLSEMFVEVLAQLPGVLLKCYWPWLLHALGGNRLLQEVWRFVKKYLAWYGQGPGIPGLPLGRLSRCPSGGPTFRRTDLSFASNRCSACFLEATREETSVLHGRMTLYLPVDKYT